MSQPQPLNKLEILLLNNGWNPVNEKMLVKIAKNCQIYKHLHITAAEYYQRIDKGLKLSLLVCGILLSTDSIFGVLDRIYFVILQKIVVFITAGVSGINNFLKTAELAEKHTQASKDFLVIANDIKTVMSMYKKDRMNSVKYITLLTKQYDTLRDNSPRIPQRYLKNIEWFAKQKDYFDLDLTDITVTDQDQAEGSEEIRDFFKTETGDITQDDQITIDNLKSNVIQQRLQYELDRFKYHQK